MFLFYDWPFYPRYFARKRIVFHLNSWFSFQRLCRLLWVFYTCHGHLCPRLVLFQTHSAILVVESLQFYLLRLWRFSWGDLKSVSQSVIGISPRYLVWKNYSSHVTAKTIPIVTPKHKRYCLQHVTFFIIIIAAPVQCMVITVEHRDVDTCKSRSVNYLGDAVQGD